MTLMLLPLYVVEQRVALLHPARIWNVIGFLTEVSHGFPQPFHVSSLAVLQVI
jgi:hypothetical protein